MAFFSHTIIGTDEQTRDDGVTVSQPTQPQTQAPVVENTAGIDPFRSHNPRAFVVIGGQVVMCQDYNLVTNNRQDAATCNIRIPLRNIDSSVFSDRNFKGDIYAVEVWAGYLNDTELHDRSLAKIAQKILDAVDKDQDQIDNKKFTRRFDGYVYQPEWEFGFDNFVNLSCVDWIGLLRDYKLADTLDNEACEFNNVVSAVNKNFSGIKVTMKPYAGKKYLAEQKDKDHPRQYKTSGESMFATLQKIAQKLNYFILCKGKNIIMEPLSQKVTIHTFYYGNYKNNKDPKDGSVIGEFFKSLKIRNGQKGRPDPRTRIARSSYVVRVLGQTGDKKPKPINESYPKDAIVVKGETHEEIIKLTKPTTSAEAKAVAENIYKQKSRALITGSLELPFANIFIKVHDVVKFYIDKDTKEAFEDAGWLHDLKFVVSSISESFSMSGFSQVVEFESDPFLEGSPVKGIGPKVK